MSGWQPISTARKDLPLILGHSEKRWIRFGRYISSHAAWYYSGTNERSQYSQRIGDEPTHWMPLPDPPTAQAEVT